MGLFDNYNANTLPEENEFTRRVSSIKIKNEPIICKLVPIMNMQDSKGNPLLFYPFSRFTFTFEKNGKKVNYTRPSLKVKDQNDPQFDKYLSLKEQLKGLQKNTKEYIELDQEAKALAPSRKAIIFVHVQGSDGIQAMEIPDSLNQQLFGAEAYGDRPAKEGLYQEMRRKGVNLFDVLSSKGWLKFTRKGSTWNDTEYSVVPYKVTKIIDGEEVDVNYVQEVSPHLKELKDEDLPNAKEVAGEYSWTVDEVNTYLNTQKVPDRLLGKRPESSQASTQTTPAAQEVKATSAKTESAKAEVGQTKSFSDSLDEAFR